MSHHSSLPPEIDEAIRSFIRRHKRGLRWGCLVTSLLALVLVAVAGWGIYRGALRLKDVVKDSVAGKIPAIRLPLEWEKPLGDSALAQLRGKYQFITDRQVLDPLDRIAAPLLSAPANSSDRYTLFVTTSKEINAFALPGGTIVFHRGLLERARAAEEIQGVLAHEMAHVQKRHGVLQMVQKLGMDLAIQKLQGGESRVLDSLIRDSGQLLGLKFSRDHERAADDLGWELLERAQINPQGIGNFFAGLNADAVTGTAPVIPLLSTHPAPQERMGRLAQKATSLRPADYRSFVQEFSALQAGLGITAEQPSSPSPTSQNVR
jgi:predicted Zn-dependent protease